MGNGRGLGWAWGPVAMVAVLAACDVAEQQLHQAATKVNLDLGEVVVPPFAATGDLDGLRLEWFDATGVHRARRRSEIPEAHRGNVRIIPDPDDETKAAGPDHVYVADVRAPGPAGDYLVRRMKRVAFDAWLNGHLRRSRTEAKAEGAAREGSGLEEDPDDEGVVARARRKAKTIAREAKTAFKIPTADPEKVPTKGPVIVYAVSWCKVCMDVDDFFAGRPFKLQHRYIDKDKESEIALALKMKRRGLPSYAHPVIDFRGVLVNGFDRARLLDLIEQVARNEAEEANPIPEEDDDEAP